MKFVCDGTILSDAVARASKACAVRTTVPILECLKLHAKTDEVELFATDGELSIRKILKAEVFEEGSVCVPGRLFSDFLSKLTELEVTVETSEKGLAISYGESVSYLQSLSDEQFPAVPFEIGENSFSLKSCELKKIIAETAFCCAQDDSRPILRGCHFVLKDKLEATALDGYRLAHSTAEILSKSGENSVICPARTLSEIARMLPDDESEITVYSQGGMLLAGCGDMTIVSRLYTGDFIKLDSVLPPSFTTEVELYRDELIASVERASVLIRGDRNNLVTFEIGGNLVKIRSTSEMGKVAETVQAKTFGKELTISMNAKFLLEALKVLKEERTVMSFNGPISPFILQNKDRKDNLYLILPVRTAQ